MPTHRRESGKQPASAPPKPNPEAISAASLDRPSRIPWPPLIYLSALALGLVLHALYPLPWFGRPFGDILLAIGVLAIGAGLLLDLLAFRAMSRGKTTILPHRGSAHLVTGGPFALTRNPIYLGNTLVLIGIGLVFGIAWLLLAAPLAALATQKLAIEPEERHLGARFGKAFRDYRKRVRRWI